jgi:hypothetical protein
MSESPSISNYGSKSIYTNAADSNVRSAGEKNGRAIYYKMRKPKVSKVEYLMNVETTLLRVVGSEPREVEVIMVRGGGVEKKFVSEEAARIWISKQ